MSHKKAKEEIELAKLRWEARKAAFEAIFTGIKDVAAGLGILVALVNAGFVVIPGVVKSAAPTPAEEIVLLEERILTEETASVLSGAGGGGSSAIGVPTGSVHRPHVRSPRETHTKRAAITGMNVLGWLLAIVFIGPWIWDKLRKRNS